MPVKLPDELIRKRPRTVADLEPGSQGFVSVSTIMLDLDRSAYIYRNAELEPTRDEHVVTIRRDDQGAYHLHLGGVNRQFRPKDLQLFKGVQALLPIESVSGIADGK